MNTPSHIVVNLFLLGRGKSADYSLPIIIGSILPDIAIFWFYFWAKFIKKFSSSYIWGELYFTDFWQNIFAIPNSIILCLLAVIITGYFDKSLWQIMFISMIVHCLFDLPVHHDDAHRHFVPLSNYRFISPFSYWDKNHYGRWVALGELLLVFLSSTYLYFHHSMWWSRVLLLATNIIYFLLYFKFY